MLRERLLPGLEFLDGQVVSAACVFEAQDARAHGGDDLCFPAGDPAAGVRRRELTEAEIEEIIARFGRSAALAKTVGFTGVQIHGAHGYLVSQFLSGRHNQRTDGWGGDAARRRRFAAAPSAP